MRAQHNRFFKPINAENDTGLCVHVRLVDVSTLNTFLKTPIDHEIIAAAAYSLSGGGYNFYF